MNLLEIKGDWHAFKGKLRQRFAELTDDDVAFEEGQQEEWLGHLQKKLAQSRSELDKLISSF
ncbi:general stress protein CsbD [Cyanobium sp. Morenito 9A2]|nr:general stress protein CsbD [Cyanobium sp. Morenito 9A2]